MHILDQMEDIGYETHNSLLNLGSLWIFLTFYVVKVIIYFAAVLIKRAFKTDRLMFTEKWKKSLFFSEFLGIALEAYFEFIIAGYLNLQYALH